MGTTPLSLASKKLNWLKYRVRGSASQSRGVVHALGLLGAELLPDTQAPGLFGEDLNVACTAALSKIQSAEESLLVAIEELYAAYRVTNPPIHDKRKGSKTV